MFGEEEERVPTIHSSEIVYDPEDDVLGSGGFGIVRKGKIRSTGRQVAVKKLKAETNDETVRLLEKEAKLMHRANHPNILPMEALYLNRRGMPVGLVLPFMRLGSLKSFQEWLRTADVDISSGKVGLKVQWALEIAQGMEYLHSLTDPLYHLDLKPDNILMEEDLTLKITDFGLARSKRKYREMSEESTLTTIGGTVKYIPPEYLSQPHLALRTKFDTYSFAVTLFVLMAEIRAYHNVAVVHLVSHILAGNKPDITLIEGSPDTKIQSVLEETKSLIQQCWADEPQHRPEFSDITRTLAEMAHKMGSESLTEVKASIMDALKRLRPESPAPGEEHDREVTMQSVSPPAPAVPIATDSKMVSVESTPTNSVSTEYTIGTDADSQSHLQEDSVSHTGETGSTDGRKKSQKVKGKARIYTGDTNQATGFKRMAQKIGLAKRADMHTERAREVWQADAITLQGITEVKGVVVKGDIMVVTHFRDSVVWMYDKNQKVVLPIDIPGLSDPARYGSVVILRRDKADSFKICIADGDTDTLHFVVLTSPQWRITEHTTAQLLQHPRPHNDQDASASEERTLVPGYQPHSITVDQQTRQMIVTGGDDKIHILNFSGEEVAVLNMRGKIQGGICCVDLHNGQFVVSDYDGNKLVWVNGNGEVVRIYPNPSRHSDPLLKHPWYLIRYRDGILVSNRHSVVQISSDGQYLKHVVQQGSVRFPGCMHVENNILYVAPTPDEVGWRKRKIKIFPLN